MDLAHFLSQHQARYHLIYQIAQVASCGGMIGSAMFFPLDATENNRYFHVLLPILLVCTIVWHALSLAALINYWIYTIPSGLTIVLLAALFAGPSRADLAAWLPFFVVALSFITVALNEFKQRRRAGNIVAGDYSDDTSSLRHRNHHPIVMARFLNEPVPQYLQRWGFPQPTSTVRSRDTLTLSSTPAQARPSWGSRVLEFFVNPPVFWSSQPPSRRSSQNPLEGSHDFPPHSEHGLASPSLGLELSRPATPELGRNYEY
ncbi:hypothetical protein VP1G_01304 [Cytospora mali]|uniref:Uncharacterized protein n=1 Tax=Cytospora mali TaxID=578113 RepID=A0A194UQY1_CYTMA|nr:hypothetical protein VP1G_01304 [Valsa mali var. pyri (nom. inval.)]